MAIKNMFKKSYKYEPGDTTILILLGLCILLMACEFYAKRSKTTAASTVMSMNKRLPSYLTELPGNASDWVTEDGQPVHTTLRDDLPPEERAKYMPQAPQASAPQQQNLRQPQDRGKIQERRHGLEESSMTEQEEKLLRENSYFTELPGNASDWVAADGQPLYTILRDDLPPEVRAQYMPQAPQASAPQQPQYFPKGKDVGQQRPMNSQERFDAFIQSQIQPREVDREGSLRLLQEAADNAQAQQQYRSDRKMADEVLNGFFIIMSWIVGTVSFGLLYIIILTCGVRLWSVFAMLKSAALLFLCFFGGLILLSTHKLYLSAFVVYMIIPLEVDMYFWFVKKLKYD
ncbi:hypothetical protein D5045_11760 [Verminephrobacter eiseniae]|uniref:hypothetical protein n=1 Tax=Verminephrobacter eiseniae TaxID=364317 RepID=UPI002237E977|nr:hypothetical protein [Verminephrobacter eiseniae]MCW5260852.1 hypothetical protein [Verminephrobacter eiseniae]